MRRIVFIPLLSALVVVFAACGQEPGGGQGATGETTGGTTGGATAGGTTEASTVSSTVIGGDSGEGETLTLYSGQHQETTQALARGFTEETGIPVRIEFGTDTQLTNQITTEGSASPADVFLAANSPALTQLSQEGLWAKTNESTLENIPSRYNSPEGNWAGVTGRSVVLTYNPSMVSENELPDSILDLSNSEWEGRVAFSNESDFIAVATAVNLLEGESATREWLEGLESNLPGGEVYNGNTAVVNGINDGRVATGILYQYYLPRLAEEVGSENLNADQYYFPGQGPGSLLTVSGAGVLESSENPEMAQRFVSYMTSEDGQRAIVDSNSYEYPLDPEVQNPRLRPLEELNPPDIDLTELGEQQDETIELMREVGIL